MADNPQITANPRRMSKMAFTALASSSRNPHSRQKVRPAAKHHLCALENLANVDNSTVTYFGFRQWSIHLMIQVVAAKKHGETETRDDSPASEKFSNQAEIYGDSPVFASNQV
jgi:hypothetical protein